MPGIKATGIVIKQTEYGEANRMLSIFTKEYGIIRAAAYGAKSIKSRKSAASQFLCFSEFELSPSGTDFYTVTAADAKESFFPISEDIKKLSLAVYLCDITYYSLGLQNRDEQILSLLLNTLYAICYNNEPLKKAKCVFEIKLMSLSGYTPALTKCVKCSSKKPPFVFSAESGGVLCTECANSKKSTPNAVIAALHYIISKDTKKIFSFTVTDGILNDMERISEEYVKKQLDHDFSSLLYFKSIEF